MTFANVGDEVTFFWSTPIFVDGIPIGVHSTSSPLDNDFDNDGFDVPRTTSGTINKNINVHDNRNKRHENELQFVQ